MRTIDAETIRQQTKNRRHAQAVKCPHFAVDNRCPDTLEWNYHFCTHPKAVHRSGCGLVLCLLSRYGTCPHGEPKDKE